ncbi:MAG: A/G-specific adenine glycosylase [Peptococcaceae bacterium]|nr:A/G-specific adenine glycosylase [Peptococcaceae bacterium]
MERFKNGGFALCQWYWQNRRELPWRKNRDPYGIWISEIMLQQTRVDTVIEYYRNFLGRFPDIFTLAQAEEEEVLGVWQGLGYYPRARNLYRTAQIIAKKYGGVFPDTFKVVSSLPGIGEYTAGAIVSIAYNQAHPAVDGNVLRVVSRWEGIEEDIGKDKMKKRIGAITLSMMPEGQAGDFNQALMELGAMVCVPAHPLCGQCPLQSSCKAFAAGKQEELPLKTRKEKRPDLLEYWVAVIQRDGLLLMEHRQNETLLGKMWGLPMVKVDSPPDGARGKDALSPIQLFQEQYDFTLRDGRKLGRVRHIFTHQIWEMEVMEFDLLNTVSLAQGWRWVAKSEMKELPIPIAFQKILRLLS